MSWLSIAHESRPVRYCSERAAHSSEEQGGMSGILLGLMPPTQAGGDPRSKLSAAELPFPPANHQQHETPTRTTDAGPCRAANAAASRCWTLHTSVGGTLRPARTRADAENFWKGWPLGGRRTGPPRAQNAWEGGRADTRMSRPWPQVRMPGKAMGCGTRMSSHKKGATQPAQIPAEPTASLRRQAM